MELAERGVSSSEIARRTGIPRRRVADWRAGSRIGMTSREVSVVPSAAYAYVLGMYLGDGCISRAARTHRLRITLDTAYPDIIDACAAAIGLVKPGRPPRSCRGRSAPSTCRRTETPGSSCSRSTGPERSMSGESHSSGGSYVVNRVRSSSGRAYSYDPVLLQQPLGGHPPPLRLGMRSHRRRGEADRQLERRGLAPRLRRDPERLPWTEERARSPNP